MYVCVYYCISAAKIPLPALIDDGRLHPGPGNGQLRVGQRFFLEPGNGSADLVVMMVVVVMVESGPGVLELVLVVQPEHEAGRGRVPMMVAGRRGVQFSAPRGNRIQFTAAADAAADAAAVADADAAAVTAAADHGVINVADDIIT